MKKIVLKVVNNVVGQMVWNQLTSKKNFASTFFRHILNHRMALDRRNYRQLVDTTVEIANKVGAVEIVHECDI